MPYKDKEQAKACWRRRNAKPERKAYMREYAKEYMTNPNARKRAYAAHKRWENKPTNKAERAAYALERRRTGKVREETKDKQLQRKKLLRKTDGPRIKALDQTRKLTKREKMAGRPRPSACEVCLNTRGRIVFEHCHKHGHFRGWACSKCNWILGAVKDDIQYLRKLIAYLERNRTNTAPQLTLAGI